MRTISLLFLILCLSNCLYLLRDPKDPQAAQVQPPAVPIALVGFYPYIATELPRTATTKPGQMDFEAGLLYHNRLRDLLGIGRPATELLKDGTNHTIAPQTVEAFMKTYLDAVGQSGLKELKSIITYEDNKPRLRNLQADYIVLGIHQPAFEEPQTPMLTLATTVISALTLGILPQVAQLTTSSRFLVYDKKLQLVKSFEYKSDYVRLFSLVVIPFRNDEVAGVPDVKKSPYPRAWDPDILDFRAAFIKFLQNPSAKDDATTTPAKQPATETNEAKTPATKSE